MAVNHFFMKKSEDNSVCGDNPMQILVAIEQNKS